MGMFVSRMPTTCRALWSDQTVIPKAGLHKAVLWLKPFNRSEFSVVVPARYVAGFYSADANII